MENPKIRFKGFTKDWEQRRFGEITELKSASRVHKDEWTSNGVPFYRSSDVMTAINGTENEKAFISEELYEKLSKVSGKLEEGDILVTGGGSVGNPYIVPDNKPLYTKDADLLWIKNKGKFHPYFLYEFFFSPTFRNYLGSISHVGTIAHYTITQLSDTPIGLPIFEEQKEVGEYFQSLDRLITLHQRKCDQTKNLKKYMLQKMFPQNGAKVPEIRFDGYTYDWEQRKLIDYLEVSSEKNRDNRFTKDDVLSVSGEYGIVNQIEFQGRSFAGASVSNYGVVENGDVVYTKSPLKSNPYGIIKTNKGIPGIVSTLYAVYKPKEITDSKFVQIYFELDSRMNSYMHPLVNKGAKNDMKVSAENALKGMVSFPKKDEQEMISLYFSNLDHLITLHQRKCDELKKMKKYMLQNMFI